jgi:hypothetical protein
VSTALGNSFSYPPTIVRSLTLRTIPFWYLWCQEPLGRTVPPVVSSILSRIRYFSLPRRSGPNSAQPLTAPDQSQQHHLPHQLHQGVPAIRLSATRSTSRRGIELDWRGWRSWDLVGFGVTLERATTTSTTGSGAATSSGKASSARSMRASTLGLSLGVILVLGASGGLVCIL